MEQSEKVETINEDDLGIFQNQEQVAKNLKTSAEAIGAEINPETIDKLADGAPQEVYVAKGNCKMCYGRGTVDFVPNKKGQDHHHKEPMKTGAWKDKYMVKALCPCVKSRLV